MENSPIVNLTASTAAPGADNELVGRRPEHSQKRKNMPYIMFVRVASWHINLIVAAVVVLGSMVPLASCQAVPSTPISPTATYTPTPNFSPSTPSNTPTASAPSPQPGQIAISPSVTVSPTPSSVATAPTTPVSVQPDYSAIDQYALNTPTSQEGNIATLTAYLIKPTKNETEKARVIFRWITNNITYDIKSFLTGAHTDQSEQTVLTRRTAVCQGFSNLFLAMAKSAGLSAIFVGGVARDYFKTDIDHAWNAIKINGKWQLLDSTFGSGYIDENNTYVASFDDFYFLTPPEQFIYAHFPDDSQWQLLPTPLSRDAFDGLPLVTSLFFKSGLGFANYTNGTISTAAGVSVYLTAPNGVTMMASLQQGLNSLPANLTFCQRENITFSVSAVFPSQGNYVLVIFAKQKTEQNATFHNILEYLVKVSQNPASTPIGFPDTYADFSNTGSYLYSPKEGNLISGSLQTFKLDLPGAEDAVVLINGQDLHELNKQGTTFEGQVTVAKGEIVVGARYPNETNYRILLKYNGI